MAEPSQLNEVMRALGRLEGKVDTLLSTREAEREDQQALEGRVRSLEKSRSYQRGISVALSTALTAIAGLFSFHGSLKF